MSQSVQTDINFPALTTFYATPEWKILRHSDKVTRVYDIMTEPNEDHKGYDLVIHMTVDWEEHRIPHKNRAIGFGIQQTRECAITGRILERSEPVWYGANHRLYWIKTYQMAHMSAILHSFRYAAQASQNEVDAGYRLQAIRFKLWHRRLDYEETVPMINHHVANPDPILGVRHQPSRKFDMKLQLMQAHPSKEFEEYGARMTMQRILEAMADMARCHSDKIPIQFEEGADEVKVDALLASKSPPDCRFLRRIFCHKLCNACVLNKKELDRQTKLKELKVKRQVKAKKAKLKREVFKQEVFKQETVDKLKSEERPAFDLYSCGEYTGLR